MSALSVLITGGTTGIGLATAELFLERGYRVAVGYLHQGVVPEGAWGFQADIRDAAQVDSLVSGAVEALGGIDLLVNCASVTGSAALASFLDASVSHIDNIVDTNLKGTILVSQRVARSMVAAGRRGTIIHVASVGAARPQQNAAVYCATKAAQVMLAKSMALELAPYGIRVNCVSPGDIHTAASANVVAPDRSTPLGRRGTPREIAEAIAYLESPGASFITGANLVVDGGFLLV